jgi:putative addiction module CopG family antidote
MRITIPRDLEDFVKEKIETGRYRDPSVAVNDGLRLLKERDKAEFERLRGLLKDRMKEAEQGDSVPFNAALRDQIRRRGMKRIGTMKRTRV